MDAAWARAFRNMRGGVWPIWRYSRATYPRGIHTHFAYVVRGLGSGRRENVCQRLTDDSDPTAAVGARSRRRRCARGCNSRRRRRRGRIPSRPWKRRRGGSGGRWRRWRPRTRSGETSRWVRACVGYGQRRLPSGNFPAGTSLWCRRCDLFRRM